MRNDPSRLEGVSTLWRRFPWPHKRHRGLAYLPAWILQIVKVRLIMRWESLALQIVAVIICFVPSWQFSASASSSLPRSKEGSSLGLLVAKKIPADASFSFVWALLKKSATWSCSSPSGWIMMLLGFASWVIGTVGWDIIICELVVGGGWSGAGGVIRDKEAISAVLVDKIYENPIVQVGGYNSCALVWRNN